MSAQPIARLCSFCSTPLAADRKDLCSECAQSVHAARVEALRVVMPEFAHLPQGALAAVLKGLPKRDPRRLAVNGIVADQPIRRQEAPLKVVPHVAAQACRYCEEGSAISDDKPSCSKCETTWQNAKADVVKGANEGLTVKVAAKTATGLMAAFPQVREAVEERFVKRIESERRTPTRVRHA